MLPAHVAAHLAMPDLQRVQLPPGCLLWFQSPRPAARAFWGKGRQLFLRAPAPLSVEVVVDKVHSRFSSRPQVHLRSPRLRFWLLLLTVTQTDYGNFKPNTPAKATVSQRFLSGNWRGTNWYEKFLILEHSKWSEFNGYITQTWKSKYKKGKLEAVNLIMNIAANILNKISAKQI